MNKKQNEMSADNTKQELNKESRLFDTIVPETRGHIKTKKKQ